MPAGSSERPCRCRWSRPGSARRHAPASIRGRSPGRARCRPVRAEPKNGRNKLSCAFGGSPGPSSAMSIAITPFSRTAAKRSWRAPASTALRARVQQYPVELPGCCAISPASREIFLWCPKNGQGSFEKERELKALGVIPGLLRQRNWQRNRSGIGRGTRQPRVSSLSQYPFSARRGFRTDRDIAKIA